MSRLAVSDQITLASICCTLMFSLFVPVFSAMLGYRKKKSFLF